MKYQYGADGPEPPQEDFWDGWLGTRSKELVGVMRIVVGVMALVLSVGRWIFHGTGSVGPRSLRLMIRRYWLTGSHGVGFGESRRLTRNAGLGLLLVTLGVLGFIFLSILQKAWS